MLSDNHLNVSKKFPHIVILRDNNYRVLFLKNKKTNPCPYANVSYRYLVASRSGKIPFVLIQRYD